MEYQVSMLAHDCEWSTYEKDDDDESNNDGYYNNTQEADSHADAAAAYKDKRERERKMWTRT